MICENPAGEIVQFSRGVADDLVTLDLPTQSLNPKQIVAAQRMLEWEHGARRVDEYRTTATSPTSSTWRRIPPRLTSVTLEVFENVYGRRPGGARDHDRRLVSENRVGFPLGPQRRPRLPQPTSGPWMPIITAPGRKRSRHPHRHSVARSLRH